MIFENPGYLYEVWVYEEAVFMAPNEDNYYYTKFKNWNELNTFIDELRSNGVKAFGKEAK